MANVLKKIAPGDRIIFRYKNHRGEVGERLACVASFFWGTTSYHADPQWLMEATDAAKSASRIFAMRDMEDVTHER